MPTALAAALRRAAPTASLLLTLLAVATPPVRAQEPLPAGQPRALPERWTASAVADELDLTLRWLRSQWNQETGTYGDVRTTARVLTALAKSPRAYRYDHGPFMARAFDALLARQGDDGRFRDPGASDAEAELATRDVIETLHALPDAPGAKQARERLAAIGVTGPPRGAPRPANAEDARSTADRLFRERRGDGSIRGSIIDTASAVLVLNGTYDVIAAAEPRGPARAAQPLPPFDAADDARVTQALARGAAFLAANPADTARPGRFGVGANADPGITAMVLAALQTIPAPRPEEVQRHIDAGLAWLRSLQKEDGSIHDGKLANYVTSASVMALVRAGDPADAERLLAAQGFLVRLQADEGDGYEEGDRYYGGIGYGGDERPDLSNLQLAMEALHATGLESGDPAFRKALVFLQRTQNRSESNTLVVVEDGKRIRSGDDGGAAYAPGESKAGLLELPDGTFVARSYGSMTYALLRGYLFAGLSRDDPRVKAAWNWLRQNYTLDVNPGFEASSDPVAPYQGLFYYFYSMAKALDAYGEELIADPAGVEHPWRKQLAGRIAAMQRPDGSWINANSPRWWEGNPVLASAYAMLVLDATRPRSTATPPE